MMEFLAYIGVFAILVCIVSFIALLYDMHEKIERNEDAIENVLGNDIKYLWQAVKELQKDGENEKS